MLEDKIWDPIQEAEERKLKQIRGKRNKVTPTAGDTVGVGLAISGGGIRTATLNLGIVEVLREKGILERVDYLSTVSGGGFVGSWLVANAHRFEDWLKKPDPKSKEDPWDKSIKYLRRYASYLSPRLGLLSADSWTLGMIWIRNTLLIQITLAFFLATLMLLPRVVGSALQGWSDLPTWRLAIPLLLFIYANYKITQNLRHTIFAEMKKPVGQTDLEKAAEQAEEKKHWGQVSVQHSIVAPMFAFSLLAGSELWGAIRTLVDKNKVPETQLEYSYLWLWLCKHEMWPYAVLVSIAILGFFGFYSLRERNRKRSGHRYAALSAFVATAALYSLIVLLLFLFQSWVPRLPKIATGGYWYSFLVGSSAVVYAFSLAIVLQIGMLGSSMPDERREWWSRLGAWFFIYGSAWFLLSVVSVLAPYFLSWVQVKSSYWIASAGAGWIATTVAAIFSAKSGGTSGPRGKQQSQPMELVAAIGPYAFLAGLFMAVAAGVHWAMIQTSSWKADSVQSWSEAPLMLNYWHQMSSLSTGAYLIALAITLTGLTLFAWRVDINEFSLNMFYRNRIVRCYLGASNDQNGMRVPHPFTGFDENDDVNFLDIAKNANYAGPFPIVNATLNLAASSDLEGGIQSRQSAPFFFTPLHAGSERELVQFREQEKYIKGGVSMGTAVAISGAAASPNQGYHTSPVTGFLMTVFNVRLGWWTPNPEQIKATGPEDPGLKFSMKYLLKELFGMAGDDSKYVNLSDGGHLENLGIYELVRRKCNLIIAGDGEQDIDMHFGSLGNVIRMCKVDHGANIEIDISGIHKDETTGLSESHCAVGKITYADGSHGTLIYLKSSLTGDEPTDIQQYKSDHLDFPHETTADQFFNEAQFESYRKLGRHIAEVALEEALAAIGNSRDLTLVFPVLMTQIWHPKSSAGVGAASNHARMLGKIWSEIRDNADLAFLDRQTYPEWETANPSAPGLDPAPWYPTDEKQFRKGFYICNQIIQLMESVYHDLKLGDESGHPNNSGWMNFFRHWSSSGMFRVTWAISGCTYGSAFQRFCRVNLGLSHDRDFVRKVSSFPLGTDRLNPVESQILKALAPIESDELKILEIEVKDRLNPARILTLPVGFALIRDGKLRYMRIQDHLRQTGLGTHLLKESSVTGLELPEKPIDKTDDWDAEKFKKWARRRGIVQRPANI